MKLEKLGRRLIGVSYFLLTSARVVYIGEITLSKFLKISNKINLSFDQVAKELRN